MSYSFTEILNKVQYYISLNYAGALTDTSKLGQLNSYIEKALRDNNYSVEGLTQKELRDRIYSEMAEYSVITKYLGRDDIEEININSWDDIAITYTDGSIKKTNETLLSPQHAEDIVKRLLQHSGMVIDNAVPIAQGHLPGNTRITASKNPIVDKEIGISASIRLLHPANVTLEQIVKTKSATRKMVDFLSTALRYGISFMIAGATSSGKTTLLNALLSTIPDNKRIFTLESGSREFSLIKKENGKTVNNVVHTLSRPSEKSEYNITQEDLVVMSLRFNPDIVAVGEIRDVEAYSAVEAALTGHTVVSTIHATAASSAHLRLALLCQKRFPIDFSASLMQAGQAFPLVIYERKLEDNSRRIMDISECIINSEGKCEYRSLFRYLIKKNEIRNGQYIIYGDFEQPNIMSENLKNKLIQSGIPMDTLQKFLEKGADY